MDSNELNPPCFSDQDDDNLPDQPEEIHILSSKDPDALQPKKKEKRGNGKVPIQVSRVKKLIQGSTSRFFKELIEQIQRLQEQGHQLKITVQNAFLLEIQRLLYQLVSLSSQKLKVVPQALLPKQVVLLNSHRKEISLFESQRLQISKFQLRGQNKLLPDYCSIVFDQKRRDIYLLAGSKLDPLTNTFMPHPFNLRVNHFRKKIDTLPHPLLLRIKAAAVISQDSIFLFGGLVTNQKIRTNSIQRFFMKEDRWEQVGKMNERRACCSAVVMGSQRRIYITGGVSRENEVSRTIQFFSLQTSKTEYFLIKNPFVYQPKHMHFSVPLNAHCFLILGGIHSRVFQKSRQLQVLDTESSVVHNLGDELALGCAEDYRSSGCSFGQGNIYCGSFMLGEQSSWSLKSQSWGVISFNGERSLLKKIFIL